MIHVFCVCVCVCVCVRAHVSMSWGVCIVYVLFVYTMLIVTQNILLSLLFLPLWLCIPLTSNLSGQHGRVLCHLF